MTARDEGAGAAGGWAQEHLGAQKHRIRGLFGCGKVSQEGRKWR